MRRYVVAVAVAAAVLALPVASWAECAWVLWNHYSMMLEEAGVARASSQWTIVGSVEARAACDGMAERAAAKYASDAAAAGSAVARTSIEGGLRVEARRESHSTVNNFKCLPAGVDPREPQAR